MVARESAYKLREAVISQTDARIVVLELSEVRALGGGGFGMLVFLQRWAREHNIRFVLFHPSKSVQSKLENARSIAEFYIASLGEMKAILAYATADTGWPLESATLRQTPNQRSNQRGQ